MRIVKIFFLFLVIISNIALSQGKRVEYSARSLVGVAAYMGQPIKKLIGNVVMRHHGVNMYSDSTYVYDLKNELEAFNHIRIVKSDSQKISGDHMNYYGDIRLARVTGQQVILTNKTLNLYTKILDYDMVKDEAKYFNSGTVIDKENKLVSETGTYYKNRDLIIFTKNVVFTDKKYIIYTDTLEYNTETRIVRFQGPTTIIGPDGITNSTNGTYNSLEKTVRFKGRTTINYQGFRLIADKVSYDQFSKAGVAIGNVQIKSLADSITIFGDQANYWGAIGRTKVFPFALMQQVSNGGKDTLFLSSDTLLAINDTVKKEKKMFAYHHVKIFEHKMQSICDSMVNDMIDSTITLFKDPVLWNGKNQMRGDTIKIISKNKKIDKVRFRTKAFVISQDTLNNFNQMKGKNMVATFEKNKIKTVDVKEAAESIFYVLKEDTVLTGVNSVESVDMQIRFENQKVKKIVMYKKPKGKLIPLHELKPEDERLKGFKWRVKERTTKKLVLGKYYMTI